MATGGRVFNYLVPHYGTFGGTTSLLEFTSGTWVGWVRNCNETFAYAFIEALNGSFQGYRLAWERGGFPQRFTMFDSVDWRFSNTLTDGDLNDGDWHHIAWTFASGGDFKFYFDGGQLGATGTCGTILTAGGATKYFGRDDSTYLAGEVSEWAPYSTVLSAADILQLALGASPMAVGDCIDLLRFNTADAVITGERGVLTLTLTGSPGVSSAGPTVDEPVSASAGGDDSVSPGGAAMLVSASSQAFASGVTVVS